MKKVLFLILSWGLYLILALLMFWSVYRISRDPYAAIKDAEVPQQTKDFFADMFGKFDINIKFIDLIDDKSWSNDHDYGEDSQSGLIKTEDENFVIYYDTLNSTERTKAGLTLKFANENINPLADLFGKYFYPADVKGRKLPIYIVNNEESFSRIYTQLSGATTNTQWMAGVCMSTISSTGEVLTNGIILKDFGQSGEQDQFRLNLKHEMAHYTHLNNVKWLSTHPMIWETEGFAMYFENDKNYFKRLNTNISGAVGHINLSDDVKNYLDSYWVGYSVMLCISDIYSSDEAKEYLRNSYQLPANKNFEKSISMSIGAFESNWEQYVRTKY